MQDFTNLKVWQKAHNFTINLYKITSQFPTEEKFGRNSDREFGRFVDIAQGSTYEVKCQFILLETWVIFLLKSLNC